MKKLLLSIMFVVLLVSFSYAAEEIMTVGNGAHVQAFSDFDPFVFNSYVCDSTGSGCSTPVKVIFNTPVLHFSFWAHMSQTYYRHYLVSDSAGTVVFYQFTSSSLSAFNYYNFDLPVTLSNGDYVFTAVVAGSNSGLIITDQYKFSVR